MTEQTDPRDNQLPAEGQAWIDEVDRLMKRDWCIGAVDAGIEEQQLIRHWRDGNKASAFVEWFADKYDLIRF